VSAPRHLVYVGTYTRSGRSEGIHVFSHDPSNGKLTHRSTTSEVDPAFLAFSPDKRFLFACSEGLGREQGAVASFAIDPQDGSLTWLSRQPTGGGEPCHLCVDPDGKFVLVANHEHGSVAVFPVDADGKLGPRSDLREHQGSGPGPTQQGPHAHHVTFDPVGKRVLVTDKGIDQVVVYQLDTTSGKLVPNEPPAGRVHAGAAPRHLAFSTDGRYAYVNGEADMTLAVMTYAPESGAMEEIQAVPTLPSEADRTDCSTAEVALERSGRFAYVSNRGHDSIAMFSVDTSTGRVTPLGHVSTRGRIPRNFAIDPSGKWLYVGNQESDTIAQFDIDPRSGQLTPNGDLVQVGAPVCLLFS
jgi:6-phosphogluconolactonase